MTMRGIDAVERSELEAIRALVVDSYGLGDPEVVRFLPDHRSYRVDTDSGRFVVHLGRNLDHRAAALMALERACYPAPRVITGRRGNRLTALADGSVDKAMLVTYLEGTAPRFTASDLRALGVALGHLHRHGAEATSAVARPTADLPVIDRAAMLPDNELRFALRCLRPARDRLPNESTARQWSTLVEACEAGLRPIPGLTTTFLHGDAHPWNSVISPAGDACFLDWADAGPGPAIIDLGFLVLSCATGALTGPIAPAPAEAVDALLEGYRSQLTLTRADLDALDSAVAFRLLVNVAVGFGALLERGRDPLHEPTVCWTLQRLQRAPCVAERIRGAFTR